MAFRNQKLIEVIRELAAEFLARENGGQSLITVTRAAISEREKQAIVFFTVLPRTKEGSAVDFANRKANDFRLFIKERSRLRVLPRVEFRIDEGEKNRQRIDELSSEAKEA
jgi:ribosome-binding factor A